MKIQYQNGEISVVPSDIGREMVRAGLATEYLTFSERATASAATPPPEPSWSVEVIGNDWPTLAITMRIGPNHGPKQIRAVSYYTGKPDANEIHSKVNWDGSRFCPDFGRAVPQEIREFYAQEWKRNKSLRGPFAGQNQLNADEAKAARDAYEADLKARGCVTASKEWILNALKGK